MISENIGIKNETVLITGVAGFVGAHLARHLAKTYPGINLIGVDNLNDYYDISLKHKRLDMIGAGKMIFEQGNIADKDFVNHVFDKYHPGVVINLAAQAGVRYSIENPDAYIESNLIGFYRMLEACRHSAEKYEGGVRHFVYASSSSVYGNSNKTPYSTDDRVDEPVSLYAATKKSDELLAHSYAKLYDIPMTGLRFFTVYGPMGRPDMAYFKFADMLKNGKTIKIYNYGNCKRDFTYVDDVVEAITRITLSAPERKTGQDGLPVAPHKIYNIGNNHPENLMDFVSILKDELIKAGVLPADFDLDKHCELVPMQAGDVEVTYADIDPLENDFGMKPRVSLREGIGRFAEWYAEYLNGDDRDE